MDLLKFALGSGWTLVIVLVAVWIFLIPENIIFIQQYPKPGQAEKYGFETKETLVRFIVLMLLLLWILPFAVGGLIFQG